VLPVLRADFKLADNYYAEIKDKLDCPVIAICSLDDPWVSVEEANKWKLTPIGLFQVKTFLGDHFYFKKNPSDLINFINLQIAAII
jgi:surfactin synthase thioesterase subunit